MKSKPATSFTEKSCYFKKITEATWASVLSIKQSSAGYQERNVGNNPVVNPPAYNGDLRTR